MIWPTEQVLAPREEVEERFIAAGEGIATSSAAGCVSPGESANGCRLEVEASSAEKAAKEVCLFPSRIRMHRRAQSCGVGCG